MSTPSSLTMPARGLYAITDYRHLTASQLLEKTGQILQAGAAMLQYRNKTADHHLQLEQAVMLKKLCAQYHVPLIINDDPELACACGAEGVHLGADDMDCRQARAELGPGFIIGVSCYNRMDRALAAEQGGASYLALGAFYPSPTKPDAVLAKPELIGRVKQAVDLPVVAIGGITRENGGQLVTAGADLLAACSSLYLAADSGRATRNYLALFDSP